MPDHFLCARGPNGKFFSVSWRAARGVAGSSRRTDSLLCIGLVRLVALPAGIDLGREFAAANQFLQVADDGSARDLELPRERGNVRALFPGGELLPDLSLSAEPVGRTAEQILHVHAPGALESLELADDLGLTALGEGDFDGALQFDQIDRFGNAIMGPSRPL